MHSKKNPLDRGRKISFTHPLHLKIVAGYSLVIGLLAVIVLVMRHENNKLILIQTNEQCRNDSRGIIYQIYGKLLDITIPGELLPLWDEMDFKHYHDDTQSAITLINELKAFYPDDIQRSRIDSVRSLLKEKEVQVGKLYELLNINAIDKTKQNSAIISQIDNLKSKNQSLNHSLDRIIHDFERDAIQQTKNEHEQRCEVRQTSFQILSFTMFLVFLFIILFYSLIRKDIRKRREYRQKLETVNQDNLLLFTLHRRMMLSILHDLRSPLGIISGYTELAKEEKDTHKRGTQLDAVLSSSNHMLSLTENLLEYYKLDTGGEQVSPVSFQLDEFMCEVENNFRPMAESKGLEFLVVYHPSGYTLYGDWERLYRITSNLLSNAIKFTTTGKVTISMEYYEKNIHLKIEDTGCGMTLDETKLIFNAFERLGCDGEVSGFGLGLSITNGLVSLLGGTIEVESQPNIGSLFKVTLPMPQTDTIVKEKSTNIENHSLNYPMRILLIDDDPMQQMLMREMLHRQNITCDCCDRANEVMERLQNQRYDLLITDIQMPVTDGFALLKMLRTSDIPQAKTISVLAMTARIDLNEDDYIAKGFAGCLFKPVTLSTLMRTITGQDCLVANGEDVSFSLVLHEEKNPPEMLKLFISETRKNMAILRDAIECEDAETLSFILHKITSLWSTLGVHIPNHPKPEEYPAIFRQGEWMVRRATQLYHSLTDNAAEYEEDINHRR